MGRAVLLVKGMKKLAALTQHEQQCFRLHAAGKLQKEIACELGITEKAVHHALAAVRRKLGMRLPPAIVAATRAGWLQ
jgi:DNA-binding CsgD family transcriptional regulator